jgi:hypothetical protein
VPLIEFGVPAFLLTLNMLTDRKNEVREKEEWIKPGADHE